MEWLAENWFWVLIGIVFIAMHLFGHGGRGQRLHLQHNGINEPGYDKLYGEGDTVLRWYCGSPGRGANPMAKMSGYAGSFVKRKMGGENGKKN